MKEKRIKIFSSKLEAALEKSVDDFMKNNNVVEVQFQTCPHAVGIVQFSALLIYEV